MTAKAEVAGVQAPTTPSMPGSMPYTVPMRGYPMPTHCTTSDLIASITTSMVNDIHDYLATQDEVKRTAYRAAFEARYSTYMAMVEGRL